MFHSCLDLRHHNLLVGNLLGRDPFKTSVPEGHFLYLDGGDHLLNPNALVIPSLENGFTRTSAWNFIVLFFERGQYSKISKNNTWEACECPTSCVCVSGHTMRQCVKVKSRHSFLPILWVDTHSSYKLSMIPSDQCIPLFLATDDLYQAHVTTHRHVAATTLRAELPFQTKPFDQRHALAGR